MRSLFAVVVVALVTAGCSGTDAETTTTEATTTTVASTSTTRPPSTEGPSVELPSGWTTMEGRGFTVGLPQLWIEGPAVTDGDVTETVTGELEGIDLNGFEKMAGELLANDTVDFAFNLGHWDGTFAENMNVLSFPAGSADDMALALDLGPTQLESAGAANVTSELISLERFDVAFITYEIDDLGVEVGHQYWVVTDTTVYVITFSGGADADPEQWRAIVETFTPGR